MKRIIRMFVFSAFALFITAMWNRGFSFPGSIQTFFEAVILLVLSYYIIVPISKIILLPINILSLGLASTLVYFILFYIISVHLSLISISSWTFSGITVASFSIPRTEISSFMNIIISAISVSSIINVLEKLL